jgi:hypothetical protein
MPNCVSVLKATTTTKEKLFSLALLSAKKVFWDNVVFIKAREREGRRKVGNAKHNSKGRKFVLNAFR